MHNIGTVDRELPVGTKIAQLIFKQIFNVNIIETDQLPATVCGSNGFGSTNSPAVTQYTPQSRTQHDIIPVQNISTPPVQDLILRTTAPSTL